MSEELDGPTGSNRLTKRQVIILSSSMLAVLLLFICFLLFQRRGGEETTSTQARKPVKAGNSSEPSSLNKTEELDPKNESPPIPETSKTSKNSVDAGVVAPSAGRVFQCLVAPSECDVSTTEAEKLTEMDWRAVSTLWYAENSQEEQLIEDAESVQMMVCVEGQQVKTDLLEIYCHLGSFELVEQVISKCKRPELKAEALKNKHILTFACAHRLSDADEEADFSTFDGFGLVTAQLKELASSMDGKKSKTLYECLVNPAKCTRDTIAAVTLRHWRVVLKIWKLENKVESTLEDANEISTKFLTSSSPKTELLEILLRLKREKLVEAAIKLGKAEDLLAAAQEKKHALTYAATCKVFSLADNNVKESHLLSLVNGPFSDSAVFEVFIQKNIISNVRLAGLALKSNRLDLLEGRMEKLELSHFLMLLVALSSYKGFNDQSIPCLDLFMNKVTQFISNQKDSTDSVKKEEAIKLQIHASAFLRSQRSKHKKSSLLYDCITRHSKPLKIDF